MTPERCKILLTGFDAFPGVPENASARFVRALAGRARQHFDDIDVSSAILPTDWRAAPAKLFQLLNEGRAHVVLMFGVCDKARGLVIESTARNITCASLDAGNQLPALDCLQVGGPGSLPVTIDAGAIAAHLAEVGLPATTSGDAGAYLCNAVFYHALLFAADHEPDMIASFVHLPDRLAEDECARPKNRSGTRVAPACLLSWTDALRGGLEILTLCLEAYNKRRSVNP